MEIVANQHQGFQMPLSPIDRVRLQIHGDLIPKIAELLYQADKGHLMAKLDDLRTDDARAVYLADAMLIVSTENRGERVKRVNLVNAHVFGLKDDLHETVMKQAREDIARYGPQTHSQFQIAPAGHCHICHTEVIANGAWLLLSENLKVRIHGLCAAKDDSRFEFVNEFQYRVIDGRKDVPHDPRD